MISNQIDNNMPWICFPPVKDCNERFVLSTILFHFYVKTSSFQIAVRDSWTVQCKTDTITGLQF